MVPRLYCGFPARVLLEKSKLTGNFYRFQAVLRRSGNVLTENRDLMRSESESRVFKFLQR